MTNPVVAVQMIMITQHKKEEEKGAWRVKPDFISNKKLKLESIQRVKTSTWLTTHPNVSGYAILGFTSGFYYCNACLVIVEFTDHLEM